MSLTVIACLVQRSASSRLSALKQPAVVGPNPSSASRCSVVSQEPGCRAYLPWTRFIGAKICLQSPRPMRLRPENDECSNRCESLIFQSDFKSSRRAAINPEKPHLCPRKSYYDSESLRLLRMEQGPHCRPLYILARGNSSAKPRFHR